ncbi:MAG: ABC transporter permease [Chloroflexi bacterium]|nr:ABC transporter permease [Chloroflexota bacterium]
MNVLLRKTLRDMKSAWAQSTALVLIVALGVASLVSMAGAYRDLSTSYQHTYDKLHFADVSFTVQKAPAEVVNEIFALRGVWAVTGRLVIDSGYELPDGEPIRSRLIGVSPEHMPEVNALYIREGRFLTPQDKEAAVVEAHFADYYNLHVGDQVTPIINGHKKALTIVGIAASPEYLIVSASKQDILPSPRTFAVLFVSLPELQKMMGEEGQINNFNVLVIPGRDRETIISQAEAILAPYGLRETLPSEDVPSHAALQLDLDGFQESANIMAFLMLFVAAMAVYAMLSRLIWAQRPQIGLMKALGYSDRAVMGHYLAFSLLIAGLGSVLGIILGIPLAYAITTAYATELGIPLVQSKIYADLILTGVGMSLVFAILAGISPARASARMAPATAMRLDPATALTKGRISFLERWIRVPLWLRMPLRDVFRMPRRSLTTALGIIFSFVLLLMGLGMMDSMTYMLSRNFHTVELWDSTVLFNSPQTAATLAQVEQIKGVLAVEPNLQLPIRLQVHDQKQDAWLIAISPNSQMHALQLPQGLSPTAALAGDNIVLSSYLMEKLGLTAGDTVKVSSQLGSHEFTVSGETKELSGMLAYVSYDTVQKLSGLPQSIFNGLYLDIDSSQTKEVKRALYHIPGVASVQIKEDVEKDWQGMMGLFYAFISIIFIFAIVMAFALLFNAMTINVLEREREFATMRAIGTDGGRIARLIQLEIGLMWLATLIPGLLIGWWATARFLTTFSSELFTITIHITPFSFAVTALGILMTMVLSALPAIRHLNRLDLAQAIKMIT